MQDTVQSQILHAIFVVLRPIAKILFRYGIGYREFSEAAKSAFVDVASSDFGIRGRLTNISRVAVITGLTRKEVSRIRKELERGDKTFTLKSTPLTKIIHKWHADEEFLTEEGQPATLPFNGGKGSFVSLVKKHAGDIPAGAVRTELKRVGAVDELDDGSLFVIRRSIIPQGDHEKLKTALMRSAYSLLSCIAHNTDPDRNGGTWAQYLTFSSEIRKNDSKRLRRISADRIKDLAQSFDDLFIAYEELHEEESVSESPTSVPIAIGVYYFEEREDELKPLWQN